jgi:hypothetical protein
MLRRYSSLFSELMVALHDMGSAIYADSINDKPGALSTEDAADVEKIIKQAVALSKDLDLDAAHTLASKLSRLSKAEYTAVDMCSSLRELQSRIEDQLSSKHFLFIQPARIDYYQSPMLFGQNVNDKFPAAIGDIEDAGKCLAVGLGTSAVMHLMRVMESGLKTLGRASRSHMPQAGSLISSRFRARLMRSTRPRASNGSETKSFLEMLAATY